NISPTEDDYHHGRLAHNVWAQLRAKGGGRQGLLGQIIASATVLCVAAAVLLPDYVHFRPWIVKPLGVLVPTLLFPVFILLLAVWTSLFSRNPPRAINEIQEHVV